MIFVNNFRYFYMVWTFNRYIMLSVLWWLSHIIPIWIHHGYKWFSYIIDDFWLRMYTEDIYCCHIFLSFQILVHYSYFCHTYIVRYFATPEPQHFNMPILYGPVFPNFRDGLWLIIYSIHILLSDLQNISDIGKCVYTLNIYTLIDTL